LPVATLAGCVTWSRREQAEAADSHEWIALEVTADGAVAVSGLRLVLGNGRRLEIGRGRDHDYSLPDSHDKGRAKSRPGRLKPTPRPGADRLPTSGPKAQCGARFSVPRRHSCRRFGTVSKTASVQGVEIPDNIFIYIILSADF
jgi:hypothetical protein